MQWTDEAIILSARKHGEQALIVKCFTPAHGFHAGLARFSKKQQGTFQPGNLVEATWRARLEDHLGHFICEPKTSMAAFIMQDSCKLAALSSILALFEHTLPERDPHPELFFALQHFLIHLRVNEDWQQEYIRLEMEVLKRLGFALDLSMCAATGTTQELVYVSPKSGRAVCAEAGAPYHDKLLPLPHFLVQRGVQLHPGEIIDGLALTRYFLEKYVFTAQGKILPAARTRLATLLMEQHAPAC